MSKTQSQDLHDDAPAGKYFTQILNMADDDLDPYEYRLLGHYKRVIGELNAPCTQGTRKIAEVCRMSLGKVTTTRKRLEDKGWIRCERRPNNTIRVTLVDRMAENVARYSKRSQPEQSEGERSYSEHGVHVVNTTVHEVNEEITRTPNQEQRVQDAIAPASEPSKAKPKPARKPRPTDAYYEAIVDAFGYDRARITKTQAGNIGKVATELYHAGYDAEDVAEIYKWCKRQKWTGGFTVNALTTQAANWAAARPHRSGTPAMHVPLAEHDDMLDALLEDVG